jgi:hypothetical protein
MLNGAKSLWVLGFRVWSLGCQILGSVVTAKKHWLLHAWNLSGHESVQHDSFVWKNVLSWRSERVHWPFALLLKPWRCKSKVGETLIINISVLAGCPCVLPLWPQISLRGNKVIFSLTLIRAVSLILPFWASTVTASSQNTRWSPQKWLP